MPEATTPSTSAAGPSDTRSKVVAVALELFAENGFDGTSLQQIADRLGLTKAALYYHFRSKDDLLTALVAPAFADLDRRLAQVETLGSASARRKSCIAAYVDYLVTHRTLNGFLTRDLAVLGHPNVVGLSRGLQGRLFALVVGAGSDQAERISVTMALGGMHGAIAAWDGSDEALFTDVVLRATEAVLRAGRRASVRP